MTYSIVFSSKGNTMLLAEKVKQTINNNIIYFGDTDDKAKDADVIFIGFWTNMSTCDDTTNKFIENLKDKKVFLFGSAGFADDNYFKQIISSIVAKIDSSNQILGSFMCQGKMKQRVRDKYESMKNSPNPPQNIDSMIANFDKALSHPDNDDFTALENAVKKAITN